MADSKITALTALTAADPANDMIPIVDVSDTPPASGNTKRISINNILACSPSATLASLNVTGSSMPANGLYLPTTNTLEFSANTLAQYRIAPLGVFSWYDGAGGTRMTLNSTGLGLGGIASGLERFVVFSGASKMMSIDTNGTFFADGGTGNGRVTIENSSATNSILSTTTLFGSYNILKTAASQHQWFIGASTQAMTLDASGNLLLGTVTSPTGTKIGSIAKLGKVSVEGTSTVTVTTSATALARAYDTGGLFFVSGFNNVGGSRGWWLVAAGGTAPVVIASDNLTGLTVAFTSPSAVLSMNTTSGSISVTAISLTNQGV